MVIFVLIKGGSVFPPKVSLLGNKAANLESKARQGAEGPRPGDRFLVALGKN
jgi:hypothetical protein